MSTSLWFSGLLMGLLGGPHCLAMCGGACTALTSRCGERRPRKALLAWQLGRLVAYAGAGAVVASSVAVLGDWGRELAWLRPWWVMLHLAALALGLQMAWRGRVPTWLGGAAPSDRFTREAEPAPPTRPTLAWALVDGPGRMAAGHVGGGRGGLPMAPSVATMPRPAVDRWWQAGAAGLAWIALPCGLLHAALLTAALGSTALDGAAVMAFFAIGSGISLWLGPSLWLRLTRRVPAAVSPQRGWRRLYTFGPVQATRLAGLLLAAGSAWAVWHGVLGPAFDAFCA